MEGLREDMMFEKELSELDVLYANTAKDIDEKMEMCMPAMVGAMEQFIELFSKRQEYRAKSEKLKTKLEYVKESCDE